MVPVLLLANLLLASRPYQSQPQRLPDNHCRQAQCAKCIGTIASARQMTRQHCFEDYTNNNSNDDPMTSTNNTKNHHLLQRFRKFRTAIHHAPQIERIYLLSDLHCDYASNRNWLRSICFNDNGSKEDDDNKATMILIAGDVSHNLSILEWTFVTLKCKFHEVGFVFGNHDVWLDKPKKHCMQISTKLDSDDDDNVTTDKTKNVNLPVIVKGKGDGCVDSIDKLEKILELCKKHNVRYGPVKIQNEQSSSLYVIPLLSWYHSSFDTEPSIRGWAGIPSARNVVADYKRAVWPSPLIDNHLWEKNDDSMLAQFMDDLNDVLFDYDNLIQSTDDEKKSNSISILTYSHFLPRIELVPEKRYLTLPTLHSCVGSTYLEERLRNIHHHCHNNHDKQLSRQYKNNNTIVLPMQQQQHLHAFGHSHLAWDQTIDNVRYVHVPLAYPKEWEQRRRSLEIGTMVIGKDGTDNDNRFPVCIWEKPSKKENDDTTSSTTNIGFPGEWLGGWW
eukprot:scaffold7655_cov21-Cyclotella_meneghiniana.AAC.1